MKAQHKDVLAAWVLLVMMCMAACSSDRATPAGDNDADADMDESATADGDESVSEVDETVEYSEEETGEAEIEAEIAIEEEAEEESGPVCAAEDNIVPSRAPLSTDPDATFDIGPYLMHTTTTSVVIKWKTAEASIGEVRAGLTADNLSIVATETEAAIVHEVTLTGLTPNTRYAYTASAGGLTSATHSFYTAPQGDAPVRFTVTGDTQENPTVTAAIGLSMQSREPYFQLHVGDLTNNGLDERRWKDELFEPLRPLLHNVPFYAAMGNHEKNSDWYYDLMSYPPCIPEEPRTESIYSFRHGNVFVLVVDTNKMFFDLVVGDVTQETALSHAIKEMVESEACKTATWRIAMAHEPGYSESWSPGSCHYEGLQAVRSWFQPYLGAHKFHLYFNGHTHDFERGMTDGLVTFTTGGGGGGLDAHCVDLPQVDVYRYVHHYLQVDAGCDTLTVKAYELGNDDTPFDEVRLHADRWGEVEVVVAAEPN